MLAAAAAWDLVAGELYGVAASFDATLSELTSRWSGSSSQSMAAAATGYLTWLSATAAQAEQTAMQARAAAAAYEAAFAMTVPPPVVLANRMQLLSLIATNFFGQNLAAIAATEAHYAQMWAQDAAAMYVYAEASAGAATLPAFDEAPATANPAGQVGQVAAQTADAATGSGGLESAAGQAVGQTGGSNAATSKFWWDFFVDMYATDLNMAYSSLGSWEHMLKIWVGELPSAAAAGAAGVPGLSGLLGAGASPVAAASVGSAGAVGKLSVPAAWAESALPSNSVSAAAPVNAAGSAARADGLLRGLPLAGTGTGRRGGGVIGQRYGFRPVVMARPVVGG